MQIKRFVANDNHTALRLVREAMGPDAIIIANREVDEGVEIIASGDYDESQFEAVEESQAVTEAPQQESLDDMRSEINQLRSLLENQLSTMKLAQWGVQNDQRAKIYEHLKYLDLSDALAKRLTTTATISHGSPIEQAIQLLEAYLPVVDDPLLEAGGQVILHGPTGAGKTTTIAKLAHRFAKLHGSDGVVMISADNRRIGAHEQLLALGKLLAIPVLHCRSSDELNAMLTALSDKKLVLVDSFGLSQSDLRQPQQLAGVACNLETIRHYLVLPANMQLPTMNHLLQTLTDINLQGCIVTKVDEANSLGQIFTSLIEHEVPMSYWTDGQQINEHLHAANARELVAQAILINKQRCLNRTVSAPLAAESAVKETAELRH